MQKINSRHPHVSLLALDLLDHLVKNVGYPFHLQIATKEFLNELVKRFPERPPLFPSPTQTRILALVHEWKNTICVDSKRKEDLVHIRDMHRLLTYKGYRFPNLDSRVKGVLNPENNLQTPEELEEEDRAAQAAVSMPSLHPPLTAMQVLLTACNPWAFSAARRNCKS